jgi:peptidoglycan/xylan/chitin deacetylase (PgdA/CDA1 family)
MLTGDNEGVRVDAARSSAALGGHRLQVLNLVFHGVSEVGSTPENDWWLEHGAFERALDSLVGRSDIHITFDDGFASDVAIALPALRERGLGATFFITTNWIGTQGHVSAEDVEQLVRSGMAVGSHGVTHRLWTELPPEQLDYELATSRSILEELTNGPVTSAACPRGAYGRSVVAATRKAGFDTLFTTDLGTVARRARLQRRTLVYPSMIGPDGLRLPAAPSLRVRARQAVARWR